MLVQIQLLFSFWLMKFFIQTKQCSFLISHSIANGLKTKKINFKTNKRKKNQLFFLENSEKCLFTVVPTNSPTHFYVLISNKRYRTNKQFYKFLTERNEKAGNLDKFYTKPKISKYCVDILTSNILIQKQDLVIEPSAGNGSFINPLSAIQCEKIFLDIAPEDKQIKQVNFMKWKPTKMNGKIHVIGNPPFGRQSSLCHKFIKHASEFADSISFILPISFKKEFNILKIPKQFHLIKEVILPKNAFIKNNLTFELQTIFQIWQKMDEPRALPKKITPVNFAFVKKSQACLCVCRSGNAGYATTSVQDKKESHYYFIKILNGKSAEEIVNAVNKTSMIERNFNIGAPTINRQELTYYLNKLLD